MELKFRVWSKRHNEYRYWGFIDGMFVSIPSGTEFSIKECQELSEQFTGLLDNKEKEIYEGDLLRRPPKETWDKINFVIYEVFYHDNDCAERHVGFQMNRTSYQGSICGTSDFPDFLPKNTCKMEIIGNIHSNPELLK